MRTLKKLRKLIKGGEFADQTDRRDATAEKLRHILEQCPVCQRGFINHSYAIFATTALSEENKDRQEQFFQTLKEHHWRDAQEHQEWDGLGDNAEAYALRCNTNRIALLIVRSTSDLYNSDTLLEHEILSLKSGQELESLIEKNKWHPLE